MSNPILQTLNQNNDVIGKITQLKKMLSCNSPETMMNSLMYSNSKFKQFYMENKDKSPEQIAKDYNLDWNAIKSMLK